MVLTTQRLSAALAGRYTLNEEIGSGGMAIVYRAMDEKHGRQVALKLLRPELALLLGTARFLREIEIESRLQHPFILPLLDSGEVDGLPYYVMPLVEGESLRERIDREGQLTVPDAVRIAGQVGEALAYAHSQGIVHRDIKPENILLTGGHALVADFGIARAVLQAGTEDLTSSGILLGTPAYMSPEQSSEGARLDGRCDEYALACVVYETLVGEPPFRGNTAQAIIARHAAERPPSIAVVRPGVPPHIVEAIERALSKVPADRYATVTEFVAAIAAPSRWRGLGRAVAWATGLAAAVLLLAWLATRPPAPTLDRNAVAVFPLDERGAAAPDTGAGYDVALMITEALEHAEPLRGLDASRQLSPAERSDPLLVSPRRARSLAREIQAGFYLHGVVQRRGDSLAVTLRLHDVAADSQVAQHTASAAAGVAPYQLGLMALRPLLPRLVDPGRHVDLSSLSQSQTSAVALWMLGERHYRNAQFESALGLYQRAIAADSGLVVAAVKGAQAASWSLRLPEAGSLVSVALAREQRLPRHYALFARGIAHYAAGRPDSAAAWLRQALQARPGWAEAHMALGDVAYHLVSLDAPESVATTAFDEALRIDPAFIPPAVHRAEIALRHGDLRRTDRLLRRLRDTHPDSMIVKSLMLMRECVSGRMPDGGWRSAAETGVLAIIQAAVNLGVGVRQPGCAEDAWRAVLASDERSFHWGAFLALQSLLAATGRVGEVTALVDSIAPAMPTARAALLLDELAGVRVGDAAASVERFLVQTFGDSLQRLGLTESGARTRWLLGTWYAARGDTARARAVRATLGLVETALPSRAVLQYAGALDAHIQLARGDSARALEMLRSLVPTAPKDTITWDLGRHLGVEQLRHAELALARGLPAEALRAAAVFDHPTPVPYLVFVRRSLEVREAAARQLGRNDLASSFRARLRQMSANRG